MFMFARSLIRSSPRLFRQPRRAFNGLFLPETVAESVKFGTETFNASVDSFEKCAKIVSGATALIADNAKTLTSMVKVSSKQPDKDVQEAVKLLQQQFLIPSDVRNKLHGPLIPRPVLSKALVDLIDDRISTVLVASSNVGKTTGVCDELANLSEQGLRNIARVSMRDVKPERLMRTLCEALGINPDQDENKIKRDIRSLGDFCNESGLPLVLVLEDMHTRKLRDPDGIHLCEEADSLVALLVNLGGSIVTVFTASDPDAAQLIHRVSGASKRIRVLGFQPVDDLLLFAALRTCKRNEEGAIVLYIDSSGDEVRPPLPRELVFTEEDCALIVKHIGGQFGDLGEVLRLVENRAATAEAAVDKVIRGYQASLTNFIEKPPKSGDYSQAQLVVTAYSMFERLAANDNAPVDHATLLSAEDKELIPPSPRVASLSQIVLANLLTQPDVEKPVMYAFSSRALMYAWMRVSDTLAIKEAYAVARKTLEGSSSSQKA